MPKDNTGRELKFYRYALTRAPWLMKAAWGAQKALLFFTPVHRCRHETAHVLRDDGSTLHIDVFEPRTRRTRGKRLPTLLYFHGGGFGFEAAPHHKKLMSVYAKRADCRVVCPDYGLLPDAVYPAPRDDARLASVWLQKTYGDMPYAVGGDSAGGAIASYVIADAEVTPRLAMLLYPVTDSEMKTESMQKYTDTPIWNAVNNRCMWEKYLANGDDREASPMQMTLPERLPDVYIETAQFDCLHDDGVNFAKRLAEHGARVEITETLGTVHGYDIALWSRLVRACIKKRVAALKKAFE